MLYLGLTISEMSISLGEFGTNSESFGRPDNGARPACGAGDVVLLYHVVCFSQTSALDTDRRMRMSRLYPPG